MLLQYCYIPQSNNTSEILSNTLAIISIALAIGSIVLSVWFFILSKDLSAKTNQALDDIKKSTETVEDLYKTFVKEVLKMHKEDHNKASDILFGKNLKEGGENKPLPDKTDQKP